MNSAGSSWGVVAFSLFYLGLAESFNIAVTMVLQPCSTEVMFQPSGIFVHTGAEAVVNADPCAP